MVNFIAPQPGIFILESFKALENAGTPAYWITGKMILKSHNKKSAEPPVWFTMAWNGYELTTAGPILGAKYGRALAQMYSMTFRLPIGSQPESGWIFCLPAPNHLYFDSFVSYPIVNTVIAEGPNLLVPDPMRNQIDDKKKATYTFIFNDPVDHLIHQSSYARATHL